jgi:tRNA(His) 5'-end guanylyltransferase
MVAAASGLLETVQGLYAYTESDEISVLLPRSSELFDREIEKLVSIASARAAATISLALGEVVELDGRVWVVARDEDVVDYFLSRQADAGRCTLNTTCYWTLRQAGRSVREATHALEKASVADENELLHAHGLVFVELGRFVAAGAPPRLRSDPRCGRRGHASSSARRRRAPDEVGLRRLRLCAPRLKEMTEAEGAAA